MAALSTRLQQEGRRHPDLAAFGFWLRPRQLAREQQRLQGRGPLGVTFHLVPSNVPTVAFYSWLVALLMGNPCVVRLSSRRDPQQEAMLAILNELFSLGEWPEIAARTRFIRYDHDEGITAWLSVRCRLRIIWGGDETIRQVRAIPLAPTAQELVFPDRRSIGARQPLAGRAGSARVATDAGCLAAGLHPFQPAGLRLADHPLLAG